MKVTHEIISNKKHESMVAISRQYHVYANKAVQISRAVFLYKGANATFDTKMQNRLLNVDTRSSL